MKTLLVSLFMFLLFCFTSYVYADNKNNSTYELEFGCYKNNAFSPVCTDKGEQFAINVKNTNISDSSDFRITNLRYNLFIDSNANCAKDPDETISDAYYFDNTNSYSSLIEVKSDKYNRILYFSEKKYDPNNNVRFSAKVGFSDNDNFSEAKGYSKILNRCSLIATLYGTFINQIEMISNMSDRGSDGMENMIEIAPLLKPALYILNLRDDKIEKKVFECEDCFINNPSISHDNKKIAVEYENDRGHFVALIDIESGIMEVINNSYDGTRPLFISDNKVLYLHYKQAQSSGLIIEEIYDLLVYNQNNEATNKISEFNNITDGIPISATEENGKINVLFIIHDNNALNIHKRYFSLTDRKTDAMECEDCKDSFIHEQYYSKQLDTFLFPQWLEGHINIVKVREADPDNEEVSNISISPYASFCLFKKEEDFKAVLIDFSVYQERIINE